MNLEVCQVPVSSTGLRPPAHAIYSYGLSLSKGRQRHAENALTHGEQYEAFTICSRHFVEDQLPKIEFRIADLEEQDTNVIFVAPIAFHPRSEH